MGFWDFIKGGNTEEKKARQITKYLKKLTNKHVQSEERMRVIGLLSELNSPQAIGALMQRYSFSINSTIKDEDEKKAVFDVAVAFGDGSIEPVKEYIAQAESVFWPLKILKEILSKNDMLAYLLTVLEGATTDYERYTEKKVQFITELIDYDHPEVYRIIFKFLKDSDEDVRIAAVNVLAEIDFEQHKDQKEPCREQLLEVVVQEESLRIVDKILELFVNNKWKVLGKLKEIEKILPEEYLLTKKGFLSKKSL